ncbi:tetraacyldisaccharide 4'-kinase [Dasania sp. GY-MA-18]|uniref:Tetraacyldisaccharide 4'-kinase n=1 Tax=Dasania phycosphaerae TaxID=2950436 RepID=A0A9J6RIX8_9GAMM|nr:MULTISPECIES: tetraacyldisaccharide 4'-kinase [Dasania]MCR8921893.1 tetraacyldisaccharide 4'-kinase [Dasania sp. GY-MA-18]MCZ0864321.1 tetraacyldisaccharide 4'-kinase [Dasania phycosphaerae]MCZ0868049.1 tetraacyldisaccharide 4'-kinase [Dasania phycosphaerae]
MTAQQTSAKQHRLAKAWYSKALWPQLLLPLSLLYGLLISLRAYCYRLGLIKSYRAPVPVIIVGNIAVGGTGKTPVVVALAKYLKAQGYQPGIISRGYGSQAPHYPYAVTENSNALESGDEPLLIARASQCPLVIAADRPAAARYLLAQYHCDIIIADDGLQHYALQRDIEIVVVDGQRQFGNGWLLPAGPLREPLSRLKQVDYQLYNGGSAPASPHCYAMQLQPQALVNLHTGASLSTEQWPHKHTVHAVAGIGNPQRFFNSLKALGFNTISHSFADHHHYSASDLQFNDELAIIMTEKDAVKVASFATESMWYLPVSCEITTKFYQRLAKQLATLTAKQQQ